MAITGGREDGEPMMDMNTTPLIDVMLVLLIMFIITIPIQTHSVGVDLPAGGPPPPQVNPISNKITIDRSSTVYWNAIPVDLVRLRQYLDATKALPTEPELQIQPDRNAPYLRFDEVLAVVRRAEVTRIGFVGNEQYKAF